jgi:outer membrane protein TolC
MSAATSAAADDRKSRRDADSAVLTAAVEVLAAPPSAGSEQAAGASSAGEPSAVPHPAAESPNEPVLPTPPAVPLQTEGIGLEPVSPQDNDRPFPINLSTALRLADARPLVVAAAQAGSWVAEAQLQRAQLLWVPQFNLGAVYYRHDGFGPDFNFGVNNPSYGGPTPGGPLNQNLNYFYGYGSFYQSVNLTDAIFEPLAARQALDAQRMDIQTAKNDALLATANAYFDVHRDRGVYAAARQVVERAEKLVDRIDQLSKDLVPEIELHRAKRILAVMQQREVAAREMWRVSSANLTQVLRLDPTAVIVPLEPDHLQITLIDPARPIDELVAIGVFHRPEIASTRSRVQAAEVRVRREKNRPLLPLVLITGFQTPGGMISQFGIFGDGADSSMNNWSFRNDVSFQLVWQLEGLGFGNLARIKEQRGEESKATVQLFRQQDAVAAEVTAAQARVQAASVRVPQADRELREAIINYDGNYEGLGETTRFENVLYQVIRPQEAVKALDKLMKAYEQYFTTVADYNKAQFELFHALGYPARAVTELGPAGETIDVDTERPFGLPGVFEGPPPATR